MVMLSTCSIWLLEREQLREERQDPLVDPFDLTSLDGDPHQQGGDALGDGRHVVPAVEPVPVEVLLEDQPPILDDQDAVDVLVLLLSRRPVVEARPLAVVDLGEHLADRARVYAHICQRGRLPSVVRLLGHLVVRSGGWWSWSARGDRPAFRSSRWRRCSGADVRMGSAELDAVDCPGSSPPDGERPDLGCSATGDQSRHGHHHAERHAGWLHGVSSLVGIGRTIPASSAGQRSRVAPGLGRQAVKA